MPDPAGKRQGKSRLKKGTLLRGRFAVWNAGRVLIVVGEVMTRPEMPPESDGFSDWSDMPRVLAPFSAAPGRNVVEDADLTAIASLVHQTAIARKGDGIALLALLRLLESLHREIRDSLFQETLPTSRQDLYALLREIEANGGWPYIHRMKLRQLLELLLSSDDVGNVVSSEGPPTS